MCTDIVIAERDALLAAAYESFMVVEGYRVNVVSSGIDCLKQLRIDPPRLLVIDPNLPWGGLGILEMLCDGEEHLDIPVIVLMDQPSQELYRFIPRRASAVILKPFAPQSLANLVRQLAPPNRDRFRLNHLVEGISSLHTPRIWRESSALPRRTLAGN